MAEQITSTASTWRKTEDDAFANGKTGVSEATATGTMVRSEDIGRSTDSPATDTTGSKTGVSLWKGVFDLIANRLPSALIGGKLPVEVTFPTTQQISISANQNVGITSVPVQQGSGVITATTQRMVLAADGPTLQTLTNILNTLSLETPKAPLTLTFTIASGTSLSNYLNLKGKAWMISIVPATGLTATGAHVKVLCKNQTTDTEGNILRDSNANPHLLFTASAENRTYSGSATAFLVGSIGKDIAFELYSDAATKVNASATLTITMSAVI